jgi:hypothetical protein
MKNKNDMETILFNKELDTKMMITLSGKKITSKNVTTGESVEKELPDRWEAERYFEHTEWFLLRDGFRIINENANIGEPVLFCFTNEYYHYDLSFCLTPNEIYMYKSSEDSKRSLLVFDLKVNLINTIDLPPIRVWGIEYCSADNSLYIDSRNAIYKYDITTKKFEQLTNSPETMHTFISASGSKIAYATYPNIFFKDIPKQKIVEDVFDVVVPEGEYIHVAAIFSKNGEILALHNKIGEIKLINTNDWKIIKTINGEFHTVLKMEFIDGDKNLAILEILGESQMHFYNIETGNEIEYNSLKLPEDIFSLGQRLNYFCFNEKQTKLVLVQRFKGYVFDFKEKKFLHSFEIKQYDTTIELKFIGEQLAIKTDRGCFGIYNV